MVLDTQASLFTVLYDLLTADATLKSEMGGTVRLYPVWAEPDAPFPYLVHRLDIRDDEPFPMQIGTYIIDIWSYSPSASEALSIRKRVIELLDLQNISTDEVSNFRVGKQTDGFIPESTQNIWHYTIQFGARFYRAAEVAAII